MEHILVSRPSLFLASRVAGLVQRFKTRLQQNLNIRNSTWKIDPFGALYQRGFRVRALSDFERVEATVCSNRSRRQSNHLIGRQRSDSSQSLNNAIEEIESYVSKHGNSFTEFAASDHAFLSQQQIDVAENFSKRATSAHAARVFNLSCVLIDRLHDHADRVSTSQQNLGFESLQDQSYVANLVHLLRRLRYALFMSLVKKTMHFLDGVAAQLSLLSKQRSRSPDNDLISTWRSNRGPLSTTLPWNIRHSLAVLWGVCWMFYPSAVEGDDAAEHKIVQGATTRAMENQVSDGSRPGSVRTVQHRSACISMTVLPPQGTTAPQGLGLLNTQLPITNTRNPGGSSYPLLTYQTERSHRPIRAADPSPPRPLEQFQHLGASGQRQGLWGTQPDPAVPAADLDPKDLDVCMLPNCQYPIRPHAVLVCNYGLSQNGIVSSPHLANHVASAPPPRYSPGSHNYGSSMEAGLLYNNPAPAFFNPSASFHHVPQPDPLGYLGASTSTAALPEQPNFALSLVNYDAKTNDLDPSEAITPSTWSRHTSIDFGNSLMNEMTGAQQVEVAPGSEEGDHATLQVPSTMVWNDDNIHQYRPRRNLPQGRVSKTVVEGGITWYVCDRAICNIKESKNPSKRWKRESDLNRHLDRHDRPWICPHVNRDGVQCAFAGTCPGDLGRHLRIQHLKEGKHWCPVDECTRSLSSRKRKHGEAEPFTRYDNMRSHVRQTHKNVDVDAVAPPKKRPRQTDSLSPAPRRSVSHSSVEVPEWKGG